MLFFTLDIATLYGFIEIFVMSHHVFFDLFSSGSSFCKQKFIYQFGCLQLVARCVICFRGYKKVSLRDQEFVLTVRGSEY